MLFRKTLHRLGCSSPPHFLSSSSHLSISDNGPHRPRGDHSHTPSLFPPSLTHKHTHIHSLSPSVFLSISQSVIMEPSSPKKIQFAVPPLQGQLDPQAAEHVSVSEHVWAKEFGSCMWELNGAFMSCVCYREFSVCGCRACAQVGIMKTAVCVSGWQHVYLMGTLCLSCSACDTFKCFVFTSVGQAFKCRRFMSLWINDMKNYRKKYTLKYHLNNLTVTYLL